MPSGRLHLRLERLTPQPTAAELEEVGTGLQVGRGQRSHPSPRRGRDTAHPKRVPQPACPPSGAAGEQSDPDAEERRAGGGPAVCVSGAGGRAAGESHSPHPIAPWPFLRLPQVWMLQEIFGIINSKFLFPRVVLGWEEWSVEGQEGSGCQVTMGM